MNDKKLGSILKKENKWEKYIYPIICLVTAILAILIYAGALEVNLKNDKVSPNTFATILLVVSLIGLVKGVYDIFKEKKQFVKVFDKMYSNDDICQKLSVLGFPKESIKIIRQDYFINIYIIENNMAYDLYVDNFQAVISYDYSEEYIENLSDDEINNLEELNSELIELKVKNIKVEELLDKYINYVNKIKF